MTCAAWPEKLANIYPEISKQLGTQTTSCETCLLTIGFAELGMARGDHDCLKLFANTPPKPRVGRSLNIGDPSSLGAC